MVLSGGIATRSSGLGVGNVNVLFKHAISPRTAAELGLSLINPKAAQLKVAHQISPDAFATAEASIQNNMPDFNITLGRKLYPNVTGYTMFRSGRLQPWMARNRNVQEAGMLVGSSLSIGCISKVNNGRLSCELQAGRMHSQMSVDYAFRLASKDPMSSRIRMALGLSSLNGVTANLGTDFKTGEHTRVGLVLESGLMQGIVAKIRYDRLTSAVFVTTCFTDNDYH